MARRLEKIVATVLTALVFAVCSLTAQVESARAQNPELGDESDMGMGASGTATGSTSAGASWSTGSTGQATGTATPTATTSDTSYEEESSGASSYTGGSDHSAMVGNFGIGFLGVTSVPIAIAPGPGAMLDPGQFDTTYGASVSAPTIGVRYWLSDPLGVEAGLGVGITSGSLEATNAAGATTGSSSLCSRSSRVPARRDDRFLSLRSVTGGVTYRGAAIPELAGTYFYGDWCQGWIKSFEYLGGSVTNEQEWTDDLGGPQEQLNVFGTDGAGEIVIGRMSGELLRIEPVR